MQRRQLKHKLFTKAFALHPAGDSRGVRTYTGDEALVDTGALAFIEREIHTLAESGNRHALRRALVRYLRLWGVPCG